MGRGYWEARGGTARGNGEGGGGYTRGLATHLDTGLALEERRLP